MESILPMSKFIVKPKTAVTKQKYSQPYKASSTSKDSKRDLSSLLPLLLYYYPVQKSIFWPFTLFLFFFFKTKRFFLSKLSPLFESKSKHFSCVQVFIYSVLLKFKCFSLIPELLFNIFYMAKKLSSLNFSPYCLLDQEVFY